MIFFPANCGFQGLPQVSSSSPKHIFCTIILFWQIEYILNCVFWRARQTTFPLSKLAWSKWGGKNFIWKQKLRILSGYTQYRTMMVALSSKKGTWQGYLEKTESNGELIAIKVRLSLKKVCLDMRNPFILQWIASFIYKLLSCFRN